MSSMPTLAPNQPAPETTCSATSQLLCRLDSARRGLRVVCVSMLSFHARTGVKSLAQGGLFEVGLGLPRRVEASRSRSERRPGRVGGMARNDAAPATAWRALTRNPLRLLGSYWPWRSLAYLLVGMPLGMTWLV